MKHIMYKASLVTICVGLLLTTISQPALALTRATIDYNSNTGAYNTRIGYTYERQGDEDDASAADRQRVDTTISSSLSLQARHVTGFGSGNIWLDPRNRDPNSNAWNWKGLDAKIARMRASAGPGKAELVITAGMAPNWMTTIEGQKDRSGNYYPNNRPVTHYSQYPDINGNGVAGEKYADNPVAPAHQDEIWDDEQLQAPDPWYEDDFAYMIKQVALRYPDVKVWQVWNEFKGMYRADLNRWDYERYTRLYNKVYTAIKEATPDAKVGGPYLSLSIWTDNTHSDAPTSRAECRGDWGIMTENEIGHHTSDSNSSVLAYWLKHKVGADFITFSWATKSWKVPHASFNPFQVAARVKGLMNCIRTTKDANGAVFADAKTLPVAAAEFYPNLPSASATESGANDPAKEPERAAIMANAAGEMLRSRYDHFLFWDMMTSHDGGARSCDPANTAGTLSLLINPARWKCTEHPQLRGNESAIAPILRHIKTTFAANASYGYTTTYDERSIGLFASNRGTMVINKQNRNEEVAINTCKPFTLAPFEVRFLSTMDCKEQGGTPSQPSQPPHTQPSQPGGGQPGGQPPRRTPPVAGHHPLCTPPLPWPFGSTPHPQPSPTSPTDTTDDTTPSTQPPHDTITPPSDEHGSTPLTVCTGPVPLTPESLLAALPGWFILLMIAYGIVCLLGLLYFIIMRLLRHWRV
ncbi:MAG: hypothetical protein Q4B06_01900 [Candidatus Saccharibacteria bacterium]|nr:hypothetical protein [Candidatus Saccharibacteria bacterium]